MKAYVLNYRAKEKKPEERFQPPTDVEVRYSKEPDWVMRLVQEAESECLILNKLRVHVGEHLCEFSIEELPKGGFVVVCLSHPELS
jgi:hypothetical protein